MATLGVTKQIRKLHKINENTIMYEYVNVEFKLTIGIWLVQM